MRLPMNNRITAEYIIPQSILDSHIQDGLVEHMNKQVMTRITDELLKHKSEIIEQSIVKHNNSYEANYHRLRAEVFVFTEGELMDFIRKIQLDTSTQLKKRGSLR